MFPSSVLSNWISFLCPEAPFNFFHHFRTNILRLNTDWLSSFRCFYRTFDVGGVTYWICFIRFRYSGRYISSYGVGRLKKHSRDASAFRLFREFQSINPGYFMPAYLIGFPNVRGHCYLISAILPLLHSYPFVHRLFNVYGMVSRYRNFGLIRGIQNQRMELESPYFWTRLIYTLYIRYHGVSSTSILKLVNISNLSVRIDSDDPVIFPAYEDYQNDLELDRVLISGVCSSFRDYCNNFYNTPGGFESEAYSDILFKLAAEDSMWFTDFFVNVHLHYYCRRCISHSSGTFRLPVLSLPPGVNFHAALKNFDLLFSNQKLFCTSLVNGLPCLGEIRRVLNTQILNFPNVLCFSIPESSTDPIVIPESIVWSLDDVGVRYTRLASSNCFQCWRTRDGFDYGSLYHIGNKFSDIPTGFHTYVTLRTKDRFIEVNNGFLYTCDRRLFGLSTPGSIHYYQRASYDSFVPSVNNDSVMINPEW